MAVISEVKCGRCDRRYSGFRSRCPYCGARRNKRGKHADEADNAKAKLIIGVLLLVLLIAATMVLILTSLSGNDEVEAPTDSAPITTDVAPTDPDEDVTGVDNTDDPSASPSESPSPSANVEISEVIIVWAGDGEPREDISLKVGGSEQMDVKTVPDIDLDAAGKVVKWTSSDEKIFSVGLTTGKISAAGKGAATLTVTIDGISKTCTVRVKS